MTMMTMMMTMMTMMTMMMTMMMRTSTPAGAGRDPEYGGDHI